MPVVTDCPYPKALPIAITPSPTLTLSESPNVAFLIFFNTSDGILLQQLLRLLLNQFP